MINLVRFMLNLIILRGEVGSEYATLPKMNLGADQQHLLVNLFMGCHSTIMKGKRDMHQQAVSNWPIWPTNPKQLI